MFGFVLLESSEFDIGGAAPIRFQRRRARNKIGPATIAESASAPSVIPTIAPELRPLEDVGIDIPEVTVMSCEVVEGVVCPDV